MHLQTYLSIKPYKKKQEMNLKKKHEAMKLSIQNTSCPSTIPIADSGNGPGAEHIVTTIPRAWGPRYPELLGFGE